MLELSYKNTITEAGCDEAGRGCLAGPVYAAAVVLPKDFDYSKLNDSKQLTEKQRNNLKITIEKYALWAIGIVDNTEIEQLNILRASITAMHRAISKLDTQLEHLLIDGNKFYPYKNLPHTCIVKGDAKYANIAAASILAKTHRDKYMQILHEEYPAYDWKKNKGYPTKKHRQAILKYGITPLHRRTFNLLGDQQQQLHFTTQTKKECPK